MFDQWSDRVNRNAASLQEPASEEERARLLATLERASNELREQLVELEALRRARAAAESANLVRGEILAFVSRSMRTPADALLGLTGLLRMGALLPTQRAYVDALHGASETLRGILNQVSDFSRLESGTLPLEPIPFDLGLMLEDLAATLSVRAQAKGLAFRLSSAPDAAGRVIGDPGRLRQVIAALVEHGFGRLERGEVAVDVTRAGLGGPLTIVVEDSGPGIPNDLLPTLFEPFGRGDLAGSRDEGLGLPIARHLAHLMGGELAAENLPRGAAGTRFTVHLPLRSLETAPRGAPAGWMPPEPLPTTALPAMLFVVESDPNQRSSWAMIARAAGCNPIGFDNRDDALAELRRRSRGEGGRPVDIVIFSDHDAEGYEEIGRSILAESLGDPALILLPAAGYPGDAKRLMEAGFRGYLVKPVAPADLRESLETLRRTPRRWWDEVFITRHSLAEARQSEAARR